MTNKQFLEPLNRVPNVTVAFWLIKLMAVTMGETAADYLAVNLGLGLTLTSIIMTSILTLVMGLQFSQRRYVPGVYWGTVVLISIVGTLVTDNLTDNFGVALQLSTALFSVALIAVFVIWYQFEKTLSIHTIFTARRERFYWLAILLTFALGTAAGDLVAESFDFGYLTTAIVFLVVIAVIAIAHFVFKFDGIFTFWLAYIFTRPLGASIGDLLSQPVEYGGLGFGTIYTSLGFLASIVLIVLFMTHSERGPDTAKLSL
ncbi:COG4705 family protein [Oryzifoliimicrobium ureilyticus]|uniref:COG4705 family protein n=1 Tax=Oryzifoliimicrobium ureilyticus TaxID=3113724 RepID=UPI00307651EA